MEGPWFEESLEFFLSFFFLSRLSFLTSFLDLGSICNFCSWRQLEPLSSSETVTSRPSVVTYRLLRPASNIRGSARQLLNIPVPSVLCLTTWFEEDCGSGSIVLADLEGTRELGGRRFGLAGEWWEGRDL